MDKKITAIAMLAIVSLILGFSMNPWTDEYEADDVSDLESLQDAIENIDNKIDTQIKNTTYSISLTEDLEMSSPLVLEFGKDRADGRDYTINLTLGSWTKNYTLRFVGDFEGPAIQIVNNGLDNIKINIQRGYIVDERESTAPLTTINATGAGDGSGSTSMKIFATASISANGIRGAGSSIISLSDEAELDMLGCLTSSSENTTGVVLTGSSINVSDKKALIDTHSNAIASIGDESSQIRIESGTIRSSGDSAIKIQNTTLTVGNGLIIGDALAIESNGNENELCLTNGGGVYNSDISQYFKIPSEYTLKEINGRWFASSNEADSVISLSDGTNTAYYAELADAVAIIRCSDVDLTAILDKDITEQFELNSSANITLDLNGNSITPSKGDAIKVDGSGKMTIRDSKGSSTVTGVSSAVLNLGNLTIEGGTYNGGSYSIHQSIESDGTLTIKGGLFEAEKALSVEKGDAVIEDGTFTGTVAGVECYNRGSYSPSITINGGTISAPTGATVLGSDRESTATLILNGGTITGTTNMGIGGNAGNGNTVIEINGGTVECKGTENCAAIFHPQKGTLTITGGTIIGKTGISFCGSGSISISGGTITGTGEDKIDGYGSGPISDGSALSIVSRGTNYQTEGETISVSVTGGTLVSENANGISEYTYSYTSDSPTTGESSGVESVVSSFNISDGTVKGADGKKAIKGETVDSYNIAGGKFLAGSEPDKTVNDYTTPGYEVSDDGSIQATNAVARIGDETYASLADAIANAENDDVIVLLDDVTESVKIDANQTVTLDLNGYRITNAEGEHTITNNGTMTIIDGSDSGTGIVDNISHGHGAVVNYGDLTLESGTLTRSKEAGASPTNNGGNSWYVVDNHGKMTIRGGYVIADGFYSSLIRNIGTSAEDRAEITIDDGTISNGFIALKNDDFSVATINGGTITSSEQSIQNWGTATINGGTLNGNVASWVYNQNKVSLTVNDGDINGNIIATAYTSDKSLIGGSILAPVIEVTGGNINGNLTTRYGEGPYIQLPEEDDSEDYAWIQASGGSFNSSVEDRFIADGFALVPGMDGTFGVVVSDSPSDIIITENGQTVDYATDGGVVRIQSGGAYENVTLNIGFGEVKVTVIGDVRGNVTISYDPTIDRDGSDLAYNLHISGIDDAGMSVTVIIPVAVEPGYHIDEDSISAYSAVDGVVRNETAYTSGDAIIVETDHNTPFYISYELEADLPPFIPFPPQQGGDPVEVWPPEDGWPTTTGGDDSGSDTLKVVACAAAVVIAALLIVVWASTYRKN